MPRLSTLTKLAAAVLVTAAATLAFPVAPAQAAYCSGGAGVSVLVDYGALGGGTATGCGGGASVASGAFAKAGFELIQDHGFVCKVEKKPTNGECKGTDSYWGFFVSDDGKGWVYASLGVYGQAVDSGDSVALVWQSTTKQRKPGQAPAPAPTASPTKAPSSPSSSTPTRTTKPKPTKRPSAKASTTVAPDSATSRSAASATAAESSSAEPEPTSTSAAPTSADASATPPSDADPLPSPEGTATATTSTAVDAATEPTASEDGGGLPGWVAPGLVALLALAAGGVAWARRAR
jgi:hypothetical protein